jgi:hypothetical protein
MSVKNMIINSKVNDGGRGSRCISKHLFGFCTHMIGV